MDSARACPSCAALAQARQRWCLECGAELPPGRRSGLRPAIGIATTLALLVGAASAGGYTLLHAGAASQPPARTVAAVPSPSTATLPPATTAPSATPSTSPAYTAPSAPSPTPVPLSSGSTSERASGGAHAGAGSLLTSAKRHRSGSTTPTTTQAQAPPPKPRYALTDVALGAAAVVYAPYAAANADLGDASQVVDGTTRTVWRTPSFADPTTHPQLGIYVDLASAQKLRKLVVQTPTPGMAVEVYGATKGPPDAITDKGWSHLATRASLVAKTTIGLPPRSFRYVLVWIVGLPPGGATAAISELSLLSLQPE